MNIFINNNCKNNKETDVSTIAMTMNHKHYTQQVDLSIPIYSEPYRLLVPWPAEENRLLAPIRPFQPLV